MVLQPIREVKEFRWQLKTQSAPRLDFASRKQKN
jgi:hypothetical protein